MHILHIANSYGGTSVYRNLFAALDRLGIRQTVFVPLNSKNQERKNNHRIEFEVEGSSIIYSTCRKWYHRFAYDSKIALIKKELLESISIPNVDLIHAHTWCLDGAVAYELWRDFHIPYITTVRNTDINVYYQKLFWKRNFFGRILGETKRIIFVSPAYQKKFCETFTGFRDIGDVRSKLFLLPNGVSQLFLDNRSVDKKIHKPVRVVYSGAFQCGKNIHRVIEAIEKLKLKSYDIQFTAIGLGLPGRRNEPDYIEKLEQLAATRGWVKLMPFMPQEELREAFAGSDIFVMPSVPETFGLVYVEALSQGMPVLYSKGQGFDGFFDEGEVGYAVDASDADDIAAKLELVINNYSQMEKRISQLPLDRFDWKNIAEKYAEIYNENEQR